MARALDSVATRRFCRLIRSRVSKLFLFSLQAYEQKEPDETSVVPRSESDKLNSSELGSPFFARAFNIVASSPEMERCLGAARKMWSQAVSTAASGGSGKEEGQLKEAQRECQTGGCSFVGWFESCSNSLLNQISVVHLLRAKDGGNRAVLGLWRPHMAAQGFSRQPERRY